MNVPPMALGLTCSILSALVLVFLLRKGIFGRRASMALSFAALLCMGLLLGGVPNPVTQIYQIFHALSVGQLLILPTVGLGVLLAISLVLGRAFCGQACPLGAVQELASNFPSKKFRPRASVTRTVRWAFFLFFAALAALVAVYPSADPFRFYELGFLVYPTLSFACIVIASLFVYRPWCNLLCPFGALSTAVSRHSVLRLSRTDRCVDCGRCVSVCPTGEPTENGTMEGCYYCGRCVSVCPKEAIKMEKRV